jgi:hypothetical protein
VERLAVEDAARALADMAAVPEPIPAMDDNPRALAQHASSLLTDLTRNAPVAPPAEAEVVAAAAESEVEDEPAVPDQPTPYQVREQTDTAMLLRELSSLGFSSDDEGPSNAPPPPVHRPAPAAADKKKRKGLFGRG